MSTLNTSIAIIGGGHAGLSLSIMLGHAGLDIVCIDSEDPKNFETPTDKRTTVISYGSSKILERTGAWETLVKKGCPINNIDVLDGSRSPILLQFLKSETNKNAFGWVIQNADLRKELYAQIKKIKNVTLHTKTRVSDIEYKPDYALISCDDNTQIKAQLIIGADGRRSFTRTKAGISTRHWSYNQNAIICTVEHENDHHNLAIEHFFSEGPFAILPMASHKKGKYRSYIVWTEESNATPSLLSYDEETFNHALNARFPEQYGRVKAISERLSYPLTFSHAHSYIADRTILVADAAHGIHPIAGQGLNLGLRDIDCLADLLIKAHENKTPLHEPALLQQYESQRRPDNTRMIAMTDTLNRLCSNTNPPMKILRHVGIKAISKLKPAKTFFMKQAMGEK